MEKYFECFNCKDLMGTVYESKCCGILYCQNCKDKLNNTHCIKCNKLLELQRNKFAQRLLKNINVNCKYNCGTKLSYDKMKQHLLTCDKKIYICSYDKFNNNDSNRQPFKGNKKEILDHLVKEHSQILLLFMENHENFEPILKKLLKKNVNNNNDINKNDTILDLTNSINIDFLRNSESEENTSIEFGQDISLLNGINDLNLINSNIQNFNDLQLNNHNNNNHNHNRNNHNHGNRNNNNINLNNRINSLNSNSDNNNLDNDNLNNNINLLDVDLSRNHYQALRELRFTSLFNDNENDNLSLEYRFNINNNNNSEHNGNNLNGHINNNTRNRRRAGNMINNNQGHINNFGNNHNINSNIINNGANNINNQHSHNFE